MNKITAVWLLFFILRTLNSQSQVISDSAFSVLPDTISVSGFQFEDLKRTNADILSLLISTPLNTPLSKADLFKMSYEDMQQMMSQHLVRNVWVTHLLQADSSVIVNYRIREVFPLHGTATVAFSDRNFTEWRRNGSDFKRLSAYGALEWEYIGKRNSTLQLLLELGFNSKIGVGYIQRFLGKEGRLEPSFSFLHSRFTNLIYQYNNNGTSELFFDDNPVYTRYNAALGLAYRATKFSKSQVSFGYKKEEISIALDTLNSNFLGGGRGRTSFYTILSHKFNRKSSGFHPRFQFLWETRVPLVFSDNGAQQSAFLLRVKRIYSWERWQWEGKFDVSSRFGTKIGFVDNPELTNDDVPLRTYDAYRNLSNFNIVGRNELRFLLWQKMFYGFHNYFPLRIFMAANTEIAYSKSISSNRQFFPTSGLGLYIQAPFGIELRLYLADNLVSKPSAYFFID